MPLAYVLPRQSAAGSGAVPSAPHDQPAAADTAPGTPAAAAAALGASNGGADAGAAGAQAESSENSGGGGREHVLVGDAYYAAKDHMFMAEQHVLRHNRFQIDVRHPYKHLLHMARTLLSEGDPHGGGGGWQAPDGGRGGRGDSGDGGGGGSAGSHDRWHSHDSGRGGGGSGGRDAEGPQEAADVAADAGAVARVAVCLLFDVLTATPLGAAQGPEPEVVAAAALVAAMQLLEVAWAPSGARDGGAAARLGSRGSGDGGSRRSSRWDGGLDGAGGRCAAPQSAAARGTTLVEAAGLSHSEVGSLALEMLRAQRELREALMRAAPGAAAMDGAAEAKAAAAAAAAAGLGLEAARAVAAVGAATAAGAADG